MDTALHLAFLAAIVAAAAFLWTGHLAAAAICACIGIVASVGAEIRSPPRIPTNDDDLGNLG